MVIGINCGHTASGPGYGAIGIIKESEHTRQVGQALMVLLKSAGVTVIDCTIDHADTQREYLAAAVALANRQDLDWFISIHFKWKCIPMRAGSTRTPWMYAVNYPFWDLRVVA